MAKGIKLPSADCAVPVSDPQNPDRIFGALHVSLSCHIPTRLIEAASHEVQREEEEEAARRAAPSEAEKAMVRVPPSLGCGCGPAATDHPFPCVFARSRAS